MQLLREFIRNALLIEKQQRDDLTPQDEDDLTPSEDDARISDEEKAEQSKRNNEKIIKALGIEIIPSGKSAEGFLGKGQFNHAYEAEYNGKHCVIKISTAKSEIDAARKIKTIKNGVPEQVGKHLPTIFKTQVVKLDGKEHYITIVEYLRQLDTSIKAIVFEGDYESHFKNAVVLSMKKTIENPDELKNQIREFLNQTISVYSHFQENEDEIKDKFADGVKDITVDFITQALKNVGEKTTTITNNNIKRSNYISTRIFQLLNKFKQIDWKEPKIKKLEEQIKSLFFKTKNTFPKNYDTEMESQPEFKDKRIQDFYNALKYLDDNNITSWADLHRYNVMMRGKDTLVASDVGLFRWPKQRWRKKS